MTFFGRGHGHKKTNLSKNKLICFFAKIYTKLGWVNIIKKKTLCIGGTQSHNADLPGFITGSKKLTVWGQKQPTFSIKWSSVSCK